MTDFTLIRMLEESINDRGLFKAIFVTGIPGAGKTYTIANISDGSIPVRTVNSDKVHEFMGQRGKVDVSDPSQWSQVSQQVKLTTTNMLTQYVNGMLPLYIDSTSSSPANTMRRKGILESLGYDCGIVWINTDLETAIHRASQRERAVPEEFIRKVHAEAEQVGGYLMKRFDYTMTVNNNDGELTQEAIKQAYNSARSFFMSDIQNPLGQRNLQTVRQAGDKNLVPSVYSQEELQHVLQGWYKSSN